MIDVENVLLVQRRDSQARAFTMIEQFIIGGMLVSLVISLCIGWLMTKTIATPVAAVADALSKLATPLDTGRRDEVGRMQGTAKAVENAFVEISDVMKSVATGDLSKKIDRNYGGLSQDVASNVSLMLDNLRASAGVAEKIAQGDLTVQPKPLSDRDTLGLALASMVERLRGVVGDAIAASDNVSAGSQQLSAASEQSRRVPPSRRQPPKRPRPRWKRWRPTSSRTPTTPPRPRRSPASRPRMPKSAAKP